MRINSYTNNSLMLQGRIAAVNEYAAGKACSLTIAVDNGKDRDGNNRESSFIPVKSFVPSCYNHIHVGMKVQVYGHVSQNRYEKDGQTIFATDIIADYIEFLESRAVIEAREQAKALEAAG